MIKLAIFTEYFLVNKAGLKLVIGIGDRLCTLKYKCFDLSSGDNLVGVSFNTN